MTLRRVLIVFGLLLLAGLVAFLTSGVPDFEAEDFPEWRDLRPEDERP